MAAAGISSVLRKHPASVVPPTKVALIAGEPREFLQYIRARFLPHTITLLADAPFVSWAGSMRQIDGKGTAYVCQNHACQLPTSQLAVFAELLQ